MWVSMRLLLMFWCALSVGLLAPAARGQDAAEDDYQQLLQDGQRKLLAGRLLEAEQAFEELFEYLVEDEVDEDNVYYVGAVVGLQSIELQRGGYEGARRALLRLPEAARQDPEVVLLHAESLRRTGGYAEAAALLRGLSQRDPEDARARHRLAAVLHGDGERAEARDLWRVNSELERDSDDAVQLAYIGRALFELGGRANYEAASRLFVESMRLAPDRPEARTALGLLKYEAYGEAAGFPSGEKDLKKVLDVNGDLEEALLAMYSIRSANMVLDGSKTATFLDRVLDRNPRCVEALVQRAVRVLTDRRFQEAARLLDDVLAIDPRHRVTLCHRAAAAMLLNDDEAYEGFRARALEGDDGWPVCDRILGEHLASVYRFADSVPFFEAALALDDADAE